MGGLSIFGELQSPYARGMELGRAYSRMARLPVVRLGLDGLGGGRVMDFGLDVLRQLALGAVR